MNVLDESWHNTKWSQWILKRQKFDAVVILHSVYSNAPCLYGRLHDEIQKLSQPKAYFIGNEYKGMPEKMRFCDDLKIALLVTMNPHPAAQQMYRDRLGCSVTCIPSAGLDSDIFYPQVNWLERPIDLGYRSFVSPLSLGHDERRQIARYFCENAPDHGLKIDISLEPDSRFPPQKWARFLNQCKGQIGTEAGGDYFDLTDETRLKVHFYEKEHPLTSVEEIFRMFFSNLEDPIPVRTISGRHVEAAATKSLQILFKGYYNGYLKPDIHYIALEKDFSNFGEAISKFRDKPFCYDLINNAYRMVNEELTYERLICEFYNEFVQII
ncbi:hypothetical protein HC928_08565 [bacterium]|nr:hypothetical protein [bacterium]